MPGSAEVAEFAARLQSLKARTDRSYEALARRIGISSSALHRYCSGTSVPNEFGVVERLGKACGASRAELTELHRLWVLAGAAREGPPPAAAAEPAGPDTAGLATGPDLASTDTVKPSGAPPQRGSRGLGRAGKRLAPAVGAAVLAVLVIGAAVWVASALRQDDPQAPGQGATVSVDGEPLLLSSACPPVIGLGQHDECVRELQVLLNRAGGGLVVDSAFGPRTLMRVIAFQMFAGLPPNGAVDERTKRVLYSAKVSIQSWPPVQVEQRIRKVFVEAPDRAVGIARCHSYLDPLWVLPNTDGTRNWGIFQLSERTLRELSGTPRQALDPEWNIQAAHRLWARTGNFSAWACDRVFPTAKPAPPSAPATTPVARG